MLRGSLPLTLNLKALVNYRDRHNGTHKGDWETEYKIISKTAPLRPLETETETTDGGGIYGLNIKAFPNAENLYISAITQKWSSNFNWSVNNVWYQNFALAKEKYRGLEAIEDHLLAATGNCVLQSGDVLTIVAGISDRWSVSEYRKTRGNNQIGAKSQQKKKESDRNLINLFYSQNNQQTTPNWIEQLVLAADQFIVDRPLADIPEGKTIIAGYPWFADWGRDTMISLPGLTLSTGRFEVAKVILQTFAKYIDKGMLPNVFPDRGEIPEYNTCDASLWYFEAIRDYYAHTGDKQLLIELYPALVEIIDWHNQGTRYNIHLDDDGLIYAGEAGVQLTWMDAKVGDWVVTPRIGKPVEINALWYNALIIMSQFAQELGKSDREYSAMADKTRTGFQRFWNTDLNYCYDVLDTPDGDDDSLRPNQIFAVSLPANQGRYAPPLLSIRQQKQIVDIVSQNLLTSHGLRSLAENHPDYVPIYGGNPLQRDGAYHQGTVWSWLIGHFVQAHLEVYQDPEVCKTFLEPMAKHLQGGCIGNISEIFDGDAPFVSRGAFAQAWSVAEVLRAWKLINCR